jgi:predicted  nucleic acid-binding Zn-ribbon protein
MTEQELNKEFEAYAHRMEWLMYDQQRLQRQLEENRKQMEKTKIRLSEIDKERNGRDGLQGY